MVMVAHLRVVVRRESTMTQVTGGLGKFGPVHASAAADKLFKCCYALLELRDVVAELFEFGRRAGIACCSCSLRARFAGNEASPRSCGPDEALVTEDPEPVLHGLSRDAESLCQLPVRGQPLAWFEHVIGDVLTDRIGDLHGRQARVIRVDSHAHERIHQLELERDAARGETLCVRT